MDAFAQQQLMDQLSSRDPFQKAQAMYQVGQQSSQATQSPDLSPMQPAQPQQSAPLNISSLMYQPEQAGSGTDGAGSDMTKLLEQHGIDSQGIQWNDMGRMQLQSRLQQKFGAGYNDMPDAQNILKTFDKQRPAMAGQDANAADTLAKGQRTLAALQGVA